VLRVNSFRGTLLLVFQRQLSNAVADQVPSLRRNNIYLRYRASVLLYVLASEAFVCIESVWGGGCLLLLDAPVPHWDLRECYKHDFSLSLQAWNMRSAVA